MDKNIYRTSQSVVVSGVYDVYEAGNDTKLNWLVRMKAGDVFPTFDSRDMWFKLALEEPDPPAIYNDTLIGYFDIHPYTPYLEKVNVKEAVEELTSLFSGIKHGGTDFLAVKIEHWILSDAIIVTVDTNRHPLFEESVVWFLATCASLMADSLRKGFPLRGAIGGGYFYKDGEVMISTALIDAVRFEKNQNWLGAVLTPTALEVIEKAKQFEIMKKGTSNIDLQSERFQSYVRLGAIPWKPVDGSVDTTPYFYLKPVMAQENWEEFLPDYFNAPQKVDNSRSLYTNTPGTAP